MRRALALCVVCCIVIFVRPTAGSAVSSGDCPKNGFVCFWQSFPRTINNIALDGSVHFSNFTAFHYVSSGVVLNDHNKDKANLTPGSVEICNNANFTGGAELVLPSGFGQVVGSTTGSSERPTFNSCQGGS